MSASAATQLASENQPESEEADQILVPTDFQIVRVKPGQGKPLGTARKIGLLKGEGPLDLAQWVGVSSTPNHPRFKHSPLYDGRYSGKSFYQNRSFGLPRLAIAKAENVAGLLYQQQQQILPAGWRPVSLVELIGTIFCYYWQNNKYPFTGWLWVWTQDIIPLVGKDAWPKWYQEGWKMKSDHRIAVRIDPLYGIVIGDFPVTNQADFTNQTIVIAATCE